MPYRCGEIKTEAKEALRYSRPRWWKAELLYLLILSGLGLGFFLLSARVWVYAALPGIALFWVAARCLRFGFQGYCLGTFRSALTGYWNLFSGFRRIGPVFTLALLRGAFCALWSLIPIVFGAAAQLLLFAVGGRSALEAISIVVKIDVGGWFFPLWVNPIMGVSILLSAGVGIWKALQYRMAPYLMLDDPLGSVRSAIRKSRAMMRGQCGSLLALRLSFLTYLLLIALVLTAGAVICGAVYLAAAEAASPSGIPGVFLATVRRAAVQLQAGGDLGGIVTILAAPYIGILDGALPALFFVLPPFLLPLVVQLRASAYYVCAEAGFCDSVSGKWQENQAAVRQTSAVWAGFD